MKELILAIMLLSPALAWAAPKAAEYTVGIHVIASHLVNECDSVLGRTACGKKLHLNAVIDGKKFELDGGIDDYLLRVGDYKGKMVEDEPQVGGEYLRKYEILLADGTKRKFEVIGETE
ncbi:MAG: hypothetical protein WBQ94_25605 [Terracidiphilus sp.]